VWAIPSSWSRPRPAAGAWASRKWDLDKFRSVLRRIKSYSKRQFRDEGVLIEQRIFDFNHLEVQVLSDRTGQNPVHFGTRNCSVQSPGHQKRIEVAPGFDPTSLRYAFDAKKVLEDITEYSLRMAREAGYDSVGTWEWIVSPTGQPFLMEVNTRIQVENGVSARIAAIKGKGDVDLIAEQIRVGLGAPLGYTKKTSLLTGWASNTASSPKTRTTSSLPGWAASPPSAGRSRIGSSMHSQVPTDREYEIPTDFDPNLALAIIWGKDLAQAKARGVEFLNSLTLRARTRPVRP
jgi:pyruvate carboxylase subunit A